MAFLEGRYREAELALRKEKMPLRVHEFAVDYNIVRYYFIWAIERQGRLDEAEAEARDFLALRGWSPTPEAALALESLARVMLSQGRYNDAEWLAKKAINIYGRLCVPDGMLFSSLAHLRLAQALLWQAKSQEALELFTMLENAAKTVGNKVYRNKILSNPGWGIALLATNRPDAAAQQLQVAAEILTEQFGPNSYQVIEAQSLQNLASMRTSQTCEGLDQQAASLGRLSDLRSVYGESGELLRIREARLAILLEGYLSLALSCSGE